MGIGHEGREMSQWGVPTIHIHRAWDSPGYIILANQTSHMEADTIAVGAWLRAHMAELKYVVDIEEGPGWPWPSLAITAVFSKSRWMFDGKPLLSRNEMIEQVQLYLQML